MRSLLFLLVMVPSLLTAGWIHPHLQRKLDSMKDTDRIRVVVHLAERYNLAPFKEDDYQGKREYIKYVAEKSQKPLIDWLSTKESLSDLKTYWVFNGFAVTLTKKTILELAKKEEVEYIIDDYYRKWIDDYPHELTTYPPGGDEMPWDILIMNADKVWRIGYKGQGIVVGNMDTGVDPTHPVLRDNFRGIQAWYDAVYGMTTPEDHEGHGTATISHLAGKFNIGVAPEATWIAVAILDSSGGGTITQIHNGFQWVADLPDSLKPQIMSNSWGMDDWDNQEFWDDCRIWKEMGIFPIFAAGNSSAAPDSQDTPGTFPTVMSVGATDPDDNITSYSGRGGAPDLNPWNDPQYWYQPDWNLHKPDVVAPADPTTAAAPGGGYQSFNGTSSATPHAAGEAALILSKNPGLSLSELYKIIRDNTKLVSPEHYDYPNDTTGWGRVDAYKAIINTPEPTTPHVVIEEVSIDDSGGDNDGELDPGESVNLEIKLKNLGASASQVDGELVFDTLLNHFHTITYHEPRAAFGSIGHNETSISSDISIEASSLTPESAYVYFTLKLTVDGQNYYRFFNIFVPMQNQPARTDTLVNDNGNPYWNTGNDGEYANWNYFAERYEVAAPCSLTAIQVYFDATTSQETLFVWKHNSEYNAPDSEIWGYKVISVNTADAWTTVAIDPPIYVGSAGYFWVGISKDPSSANAVPYQDDDAPPQGINLSTNNRMDPSSWTMRDYWYTFTMRPIVKTEPITSPSITMVSDYRLDDSDFGNGDGYIDPGEKASLRVSLKNIGVVAHNVQGILRPADATTEDNVIIIDSTASFGTVKHGVNGGTNDSDPFVIQFFDESNMQGWDPQFKLILTYNYGTDNSSSGSDTVNFTVSGPWAPEANLQYFYSMGSGGLWLISGLVTGYYATFAQFGMAPEDSIYVDSVYIYAYNAGRLNATMNFYIWENDPVNNVPGSIIFQTSRTVARNTSEWWSIAVQRKLPGVFWYGQNANISATRDVEPIFWGSQLIGQFTYVDGDNNWSGGPDIGWVSLPISGYWEIAHDHPSISYYAPQGWDWPIVPSHTSGDTTVPSLLYGDTTLYISGWVCLNRSAVDAIIETGDTLWNYLFLDNYSRAATYLPGLDTLSGWEYTYYKGYADTIPPGRHTLYVGLDWDHVVSSNIYNNYLRYWGQQYVFMPRTSLPANAPLLSEEKAPDLTGPGTGYYFNSDVYKFYLNANSWVGIAVKNEHYGQSGDSIDIDLRLFTDAPTSAYDGFTNAVEASNLGPDNIEYILVWGGDNGYSGYLYPGVYSFGESRDKYYIEKAVPEYYMVYGGGLTERVDLNPDDIIHVENILITAGSKATIPVNVISGTADIAVGLYSIKNGSIIDPFKNTLEYVAYADDNGPGSGETISYTPSTTDTFALVIIQKQPGSSTTTVEIGSLSQSLPIGEHYDEPVASRLIFHVPAILRSSGSILLNLPAESRVTVSMYNIQGRKVAVLKEGKVRAGMYRLTPPRDLRAGIYFVVLDTESKRMVKKTVVIK